MFDFEDYEELLDSYELTLQNLRNMHDTEYAKIVEGVNSVDEVF